jgi:D-alanyl-D-alanine carboxypeptidase
VHLLGKADARQGESLVAVCTGGKTVELKQRLHEAKKVVGQYLADKEARSCTKRLQEEVDAIDSDDKPPDAKHHNVGQSSITLHFPVNDSTSATTDAAITSWVYSCGIPFNAVDNQEFKIMCKALIRLWGKFNWDYEPPSRY